MKNLIQQIKLLETINQKNVKDKKFLLEKEKNIEIYFKKNPRNFHFEGSNFV